MFASDLLPGLTIHGIMPAIITAIGFAGINALLGGWLGVGEDYSYNRNVVKRRAEKAMRPEPLDVAGILYFEFDGLAEPERIGFL